MCWASHEVVLIPVDPSSRSFQHFGLMIGVSIALVAFSTLPDEAELPRLLQGPRNCQLPWILIEKQRWDQMMAVIYP